MMIILFTNGEFILFRTLLAWHEAKGTRNTVKKTSPADPSMVWPMLFGVDQMIFHYDVIKRKHFRVTGPLCGEFTNCRLHFPMDRALNMEEPHFCNVFHGISNHRHIDCLFNSLFRLTTKDISKFWIARPLRVNPPVTEGSPTQNGQWCGKRFHAMFSKNNQPPTCCHCTTYWWGTFRSISGSPM